MAVMRRLLLAVAILTAQLLLISLVAPFFIDESSSSSAKSLAKSVAGRCHGRRIFVYELPPRFNLDLLQACKRLNPWASICSTVANSGFGPLIEPEEQEEEELWESGSWYATDQYNGEIVYHSKMLAHECRTMDPAAAAAFYIPFYAGLDVSRYLWSGSLSSSPESLAARDSSSREIDRLSLELLAWLSNQSTFRRRRGSDHFIMLGRVSFDFRRQSQNSEDWGSSFSNRAAMSNVTILLVERSPWEEHEIGVPYPTSFHPKDDATLERWRAAVAARRRTALFAFAGSPRPGIRNDFRTLLLDQCRAEQRCRSLDCTGTASLEVGGCATGPLRFMRLFLDATFCLQPRGDSFTRRSLLDSMIAGCIPVLFWNRTAYDQYQSYFPDDTDAYSVFIPHQLVSSGATKIADVLAAVPRRRIAAMQATILKLFPTLLYAAPGGDRTFRDAFDVAVDAAMERIQWWSLLLNLLGGLVYHALYLVLDKRFFPELQISHIHFIDLIDGSNRFNIV